MCSALQTLFVLSVFLLLCFIGMTRDAAVCMCVCVCVCVVTPTVAINGPEISGRKGSCTILTGNFLFRRILAGKYGVKETQEC